MKRLQKSLVAVLMCGTILSTTGCQTMKDMGLDGQKIGTVLGAGVGIIVGSQLGKGAGRTVAMILGGLAGAAIGNYIGIQLDEKDAAAVEQKTVAALEGAKDGETVSWTNPDTKVSAKLTPVSTKTETRNMKVARIKSVEAPGDMELIGEPYEVKGSSLNVRVGPSTQKPIAASIARGDVVTAVGRVSGSKWIMVAKGGRSFGYVHGDYMQPASDVNIAQAVKVKNQKVAAAKKSTDGNEQLEAAALDLDALEPTVRADNAISLDDLFENQNDVVVEEVAMTTECREMKSDVSKAEESSVNTFTACKAPDGAWELG